jgi:hypothetical protein
MKSVIVTLLLALVTISQASADPSGDLNICHWQDYNGYWKLITVNEQAVDAHLTIHDDALPGEQTTFTGIELDQNCAEVASLPSCGNCYQSSGPGGRAGCEITECADLVEEGVPELGTNPDPFCTNNYWDAVCVGEAITVCEGVVCEGY